MVAATNAVTPPTTATIHIAVSERWNKAPSLATM
jgi:hypothetical protein